MRNITGYIYQKMPNIMNLYALGVHVRVTVLRNAMR